MRCCGCIIAGRKKMPLLFKQGDPRNRSPQRQAADARKLKKKTGPSPKDELLISTINKRKRGSGSKAAQAANRAAKAQAKVEAAQEKLRLAQEKIKAKENELKLLTSAKAKKEKKADLELPSSDKDSRSAYQMLMDIRYAYRNAVGPGGAKGRARLVELMKSDADFKFIVKELLKVEMALKKAEIEGAGKRAGGEGGGQNFFVILKGLETEKDVMRMALDARSAAVDMKQIRHAIDPEEQSEYEAEEVSRTAAPEQLMRGAGDEEEESDEELVDQLVEAEDIDAW